MVCLFREETLGDFKKAFDKVPHQRLLNTVECYGIKGEILRWILTFLSDRIQKVTVNGKSPMEKSSGTPHGTITICYLHK